MMKLKTIAEAVILTAAFAGSQIVCAGPDNMVVAVQQLPVTVEPQGINNNVLDRVAYSIYETLIRADLKTGELHPGLAESWKRISPESVEFKLCKGVKFHDGTDFNSAAVVTSIERQLEPNRTSDMPYASFVFGEEAAGTGVASLEAVDDYTVKITLRAANTAFEKNLAMALAAPIVCPTCLEAAGGNVGEDPTGAGTGPYKFVSWTGIPRTCPRRKTSSSASSPRTTPA